MSLAKISAVGLVLVVSSLLFEGFAKAAPEAKVKSTGQVKDRVVKAIAEGLVEARERVAKNEESSRKILGSLYEINRKIKKMTKKRTGLNNQMFSAKGDVSALARSIARLEGRIQKQRGLLSRRLRLLYKMGEQGALQAIFSSQSASDLDRNLAFLKKVADRDYELITDYEENLTILEVSRIRLKRNVKRLVGLERQLKSQEKSLEKQLNSKSRLLVKLRTNRKNYLQKMKGLRQMAGGMGKDSKLASFMKETFFEKKGRLSRPVVGVVTKPFGLDQDDKFKFKLNNKGVFLATSRGEKVRAVFAGEVSFAGTIDGYGNAVIIDHGDHYYSVYCHNQSLKVKRGQKVTEGEILGSAGFDPFGRVGLYFEIRHFSDPVDPTSWVNWSPERQKTRL